MTWISVKEKLPPIAGQYLVYIPTYSYGRLRARMKVARFNSGKDHKICHFYGNQTFKAKDITHWMELPSLPHIPTTINEPITVDGVCLGGYTDLNDAYDKGGYDLKLEGL